MVKENNYISERSRTLPDESTVLQVEIMALGSILNKSTCRTLQEYESCRISKEQLVAET